MEDQTRALLERLERLRELNAQADVKVQEMGSESTAPGTADESLDRIFEKLQAVQPEATPEKSRVPSPNSQPSAHRIPAKGRLRKELVLSQYIGGFPGDRFERGIQAVEAEVTKDEDVPLASDTPRPIQLQVCTEAAATFPTVSIAGLTKASAAIQSASFKRFFANICGPIQAELSASSFARTFAKPVKTSGGRSASARCVTTLHEYCTATLAGRDCHEVVTSSEGRTVACYGQREYRGPLDRPSMISVWNAARNTTPERLFGARSEIVSLAVMPHDYNLIAAGDVTGTISIWDIRQKGDLPAMWTPLSILGHQVPVVKIIPSTGRAGQAFAVDYEGRLCQWNLGAPAQPLAFGDVVVDGPGVFVTAACGSDEGSMNIGTLEGNIIGATLDGDSITEMTKKVNTRGIVESDARGAISSINRVPGSVVGLPPLLVAGRSDGIASVYRTDSGDQIWSTHYSRPVTSAVPHPRAMGRMAIASGQRVDFWSLDVGGQNAAAALERGADCLCVDWASFSEGKNDHIWVGERGGVLSLSRLEGESTAEECSLTFVNTYANRRAVNL